MLFNTPEFVVLMTIVLVSRAVVPQRYRWCVLLVASFVFYAAIGRAYLLAVLSAIVMVTYVCACWMDKAKSETAKRVLLWTGIGVNLLLFGFLRYWPAVIAWLTQFHALESANAVSVGPVTSVGISFVVFQAVSYLADVWLQRRHHEPHAGYLALYLSYFPKLLQGPIERSSQFIAQLKLNGKVGYESIRSGLTLIAWGLCKKVVVADRVAIVANDVFNNVRSYSGLSLIAGVYAYAIQIYADFSGYTDMAIGVSRLLNISLTQNFNSPYYSTSMAVFWRRWHITLMSWLQDYVFRPLQMRWRRLGLTGTVTAVLVVFLLSGVWHGVGWTYVAWGAINGAFVALGLLWDYLWKRNGKKPKREEWGWRQALKAALTFHVVCLTWIFFRLRDLSDAVFIIGHLGRGIGPQVQSLTAFERSVLIGMSRQGGLLTVALVGAFVLVEIVLARCQKPLDEVVRQKGFGIRWLVYAALITVIVVFAQAKSQQFVYFSF